ncbi:MULTISPECIES: heparinase II/III family protein [unclassified Streptomyces]|uniref:heparinase II/III domain-containing protein n=1 Tax=unclassified Streptomyces TaxID=2593676 RepID=UPI0036E9E6B4
MTSAPSFLSRLTPDARAALRVRAWSPAPPVGDRDGWAHLGESDRAALARAAADWRDRAAQDMPSLSAWAAYSRDGDRRPHERTEHALLGHLASTALLLAADDKDEDAVALGDAVWRLCELSAWCLPSHYALPESGHRPFLPEPGRDVLDLADAYTGALLASVDAFAGARLEELFPGIRGRVHHEIRRRVLGPWETETYFWHGVDATPNNWAPWIVSNVLVCAAVTEPDRDKLERTVERALVILDRFRAGYDADGSCDEGATYWWWAGATLFEALDLLEEITGGAFDGFTVPPVAAMASFPVDMQIGPDTQVNYSDGSPALPENANWHLLARFAARVGDEDAVRHARWMGRLHPLRFDGQLAPLFRRTLAELRSPDWASTGEAAPGMPASRYLPGTGIAVARERRASAAGLFVAAKGGHNDVSHNHNDAGGVIVSLDGEPVLIDVGVGVYHRETFQPETRYTIWTMRSPWHNVPLPDGVEQRHGKEFGATGVTFGDDGTVARLRMDLASAYPPESGLVRCERTVELDRERGGVLLRDDWAFEAPRTMGLVLMTALPPAPHPEGLRVGAALLRAHTQNFEVRTEAIDLDDDRLRRVWGERVHRTLLVQREPATRAGHVLRIERAEAA